MSNNEQGKALDSSLDMIKWLVSLLIVAVGIYGNSIYANEYSAFERALALLPMAAVALFFALRTSKGTAFIRLVKESRTEIRRVVWPSQQETSRTTVLVLIVVLIMALILWGLDWILVQLVALFIG